MAFHRAKDTPVMAQPRIDWLTELLILGQGAVTA
jgi:hypothetical protein